MGRIYILTFHNALNYGAVLQCYALHATLNRIGDCYVIDYDGRITSNKFNFKSLLKKILIFYRTYRKREEFDCFIQRYIKTTSKFETYKELCQYEWGSDDSFCVGSDQVWNWDFVGENEAYFLTFVPEGLNKFSYAASVGQELDLLHIDRIKNIVSSFSGISVREITACEAFNANGVQCCQNIDPVFLLSRKQWEQTSVPVKNEDNPFVLVYLLQKAPNVLKAARDYAKKNNLRIVFISTGVKREIKAEYVVSCGPSEFLRYFLKADAVFTNSFHGVSFSILFNKVFFFEFLQDGTRTNSRLRDITEMFQLQGQNIAYNQAWQCNVDYERVNNIIEKKRSEAIRYLTSCICGKIKDDNENKKHI